MKQHDMAPRLFAPEDENGIRWRELLSLCDFGAAVERAKAAGYGEYAVRRSFRRLGHGHTVLRRVFDELVDKAFGVSEGGDDAAVR